MELTNAMLSPLSAGKTTQIHRIKKMSKFRTSIESDIKKLFEKTINSHKTQDTAQIKLTIDCRERDQDILQILDFAESNNSKSFQLEQKQLEIGDFIISLNDTPLFVIERKRFDDLCSSVKDGRLKKQTANMINFWNNNQHSVGCHRSIFIFEKMSKIDSQNITFNDYEKGFDYSLGRQTLISCIINRLVDSGMTTLISESAEWTALYLLTMVSCVSKSIDKWTAETHETSVNKQMKELTSDTTQQSHIANFIAESKNEKETNKDQAIEKHHENLKTNDNHQSSLREMISHNEENQTESNSDDQAFFNKMITNGPEILHNIKKISKNLSMNDNEKFFVQQLLLVDRLGLEFAFEIQRIYINIQNFVQTIQADLDSRSLKQVHADLANIQNTKNNRKMGPKLASKLLLLFFNLAF